MTDIVLVPVTGGSNLSAINSNFDKIEEAINTDVLHLKGGNNVMKQDLDLNGHQLLNHETDLNDPDSLINVGDADARYYNVSGDALAGNMNAAGNKILNLPVANAPHEPMRKNEVDAANAAQDAVTATNNSKTVRTPEAIPALGNAASRADKLLSFDNSGNPVAIAAANQSATDLELRLRDTSNPLNNGAIVGFIQDGSGSVARTTAAKLKERMTPLDKGAVGDGVTDDTAAFQSLTAFDGVIDGLGKTYRVGALTFSADLVMKDITFMPIASFTGQNLLTFSGDEAQLDITVDANGMGLTCALLTGNKITGLIQGHNITGIPQVDGGTQSACRITGNNCEVQVIGDNHLKGTTTNDSIPRLVTLDGGGVDNRVWISGRAVNAGIVTNQTGVVVPELILDAMTDNGVYQIGGAATFGDVVLSDSDDEAVVALGTCHIDSLTVINPKGNSGVENGSLTINDYAIFSSDPTRAYVPIRTRTDNVSASVKIGRLRGHIYLAAAAAGGGIFQNSAGALSELSVDELDLEVSWDTGGTTTLANLTSVDRMRIGQMKIRLIDLSGGLTSATKFNFTIPALTEQSFIHNVNNVSSTGEIRVVGAIQPNLRIPEMKEVSVDIGPYLLQENASVPKPRIVLSTAIPTIGTWIQGDIVRIKTPSAGRVAEFLCVVSGTPGTWRATKWTPNVGTTAGRPASLGTQAIGVQYFDTTLAAAGKPIWWTGTQWVDGTGAVV